MILFAILVGLVLYGLAAPDPVTLGVTRGAAGAVKASIGSTPRTRSSRPRSTRSTRSTRGSRSPRSTRSTPRSSRTRPDRPDTRSTPTRSRIARAIDGWIEGADGAARRRGEAAAALRRLRDRARDRKAAKQRAAAEDEAWADNERRDRAEQRARSSEDVQQIAQQYDPPPAPPATPNGDAVPDFIRPTTTELATLDQAAAEVRSTFAAADQITDAIAEISSWVTNFPERYNGADHLYKTDPMNASVALLKEGQIADMQTRFGDLAEELHRLLKNIEKAQRDVKESDAASGRVETAIAG